MKLLPHSLLDELAAQAAAAPRGRAHYNIHASPEDPLQRFLVVAGCRSYFRPHRHHTRAELATVLRGSFEVLVFDESGALTGRHAVGADCTHFACETPPLAWHTLLARSDGSAFLELKQGPYDPATAAEFAAWAPPEGAAVVPAFLQWLRAARPGDRWSG